MSQYSQGLSTELILKTLEADSNCPICMLNINRYEKLPTWIYNADSQTGEGLVRSFGHEGLRCSGRYTVSNVSLVDEKLTSQQTRQRCDNVATTLGESCGNVGSQRCDNIIL